MRRFVQIVWVLMGLLFGINAQAQEGQNQLRLTLSECVESALSNNATILQNKYDVAIAETNVDNARNAFLPSTSLSWSISRNVQGPREGAVLDPTTGEIVTLLGEDRVSGGQSMSIGGLNIPIYDGGLIASLSANKNSLNQTQMTQISNREGVVATVKQRYFQLLQNIKLLEVQQERVRVSEESLRRSETLYEIGSAAILQVANAKSNLAGERATLIQRENAVRIAQSNLSFIMGLGTEVEITPAEDDFAIQAPVYTYEQALNFAIEQHPDILASKYNLMASRDNFRATQYNLYHPTVRLNANSYSWSLGKDEKFNGLEDIFLKNYSYGIGLSVTMPILNLNTSNSLKRQKLQYLRSQETLDQTKRQKALNIKQAYLNLELYRRSIEANEIAVQAAEENFKLEEERYNFGGGTFLERLTAQRDLFNARNLLVQAKYNYLIQMAQLENELGMSPMGDAKK